MIPKSISDIIGQSVAVTDHVTVMDEAVVRSRIIDELIYQFMFGEVLNRPAAGWLIWEIAQELGIYPSSIHPLYLSRGRKIIPADFTVPAMNFRGMAYDTSRALFRTAIKTKAKAFICELARGEMSYSAQSPMEYTLAMLSGAIKEGYVGPVFIQGDHFQAKCSQEPGVPADGEIDALLRLIEEALEAGFWNIDIDASTLVDLSAKTVSDQQRANIHYTFQLLKFIRSLEPAGITVSVGGEIGHIGGKNSTVEDFTCFMDGIKEVGGDGALISKISVATGTSHGGVVNPDGSMATVAVDFSVLKEITQIGIDEYGIAGAVQHGASTLPDEMLHEFVAAGTAEIHLATGFQNYLMDHEAFPKELLAAMYEWLDNTQQQEREAGWTDEQFHYKLRKKCWGQFKKETWDIAEENRAVLRDMLADRFELIFRELGVENSEGLVDEHTPINPVHKEIVDFIQQDDRVEVAGLSD